MRRIISLLAVAVAAGVASAQTQLAPADAGITKEPPSNTPQWPDLDNPGYFTVQIEPRAWYVSPSGRLRLPSATVQSRRIDVIDLNLDTPRVEPYGEMNIRFDKWRVGLSGFHNGIEASTGAASNFRVGDVVVAAGDRVSTSFDFTSLEAQVGYRFYDHEFCTDSEAGLQVCAALRLEAFGGARFYDVDIAFASGGASTEAGRTFGEAFAGAQMELEVLRDFSLDLRVSAGGYGDSSRTVFSIDAVVGVTWRPVDGVGVQIGWRQLAFDLTSGEGPGEFSYTGRLAGLFLGVDIRF